jgi:hypothetical protein
MKKLSLLLLHSHQVIFFKTDLKNYFEPVLKTSFPEYLIYALNKYNESSLCKSALYCASNIVNAIGYQFHNYSKNIIPVLLDILTNDEASRNNKTTTITLLGEICFNIKEHFITYLDTVMKLLISAADMAVEFNDYEDDETVEYINNLRFELIEAFTCISFGLDDCNSKTLFVPYVPSIFSFFKKMMANSYQHKFVNLFDLGNIKVYARIL